MEETNIRELGLNVNGLMRRFGIEWLSLKKHRKVYEDLSEHVEKTCEAVSLLQEGVRCVCEKDYEPLDEIVQKVLALEREADEISKQTMDDLAVSVLTSVDRGDLMNLVFQVEKIAAEAEGLAYRLERAKSLEITVPPRIAEGLEEVGGDVCRTFDSLRECIFELPSSLEGAVSLGDRVSDLEEKVDIERRELLEELGAAFEGSNDFLSYSVLKEIIDQFEAIADDSEDAADLIRILCVKHTG